MQNDIKYYAKAAKERMKSGYWNERYERKNSAEIQCEEDLLYGYLKAGRVDSHRKSLEEIEEDRLYPIVCSIIDDDDGLNPLGRLIDKKVYESLDFEGKQRYVLDLSDKYKKLKDRYNAEKEIERKLILLEKSKA